MTAAVCTGQISGFGPFGYHLAMISMMQMLGEIDAIRKAQAAQNAQA